jgi:hypothetical protein
VFATILKEISGYFDRRALLSTFLPTLVFATAAIVVIGAAELGTVADALAFLQDRPGGEQAFLITAFLTAIAFWSFVVTNLRPAIDQFFQGHWPATGPFAALARRARRRHRNERTKLAQTDEALEEVQAVLVRARKMMPRPSEAAGPPPDHETLRTADAELKAVESTVAALVKRPSTDEISTAEAEQLLALTSRVRALAAVLAHGMDRTTEPDWADRLERFTTVATRLESVLDNELQATNVARARLHQMLFLCYPSEPVDVMPTRLGNIIEAAERHPRTRYQLDPVVIWSRLQPLLPSEFSSLLKDAKAAVDLMLTLAAYLILFGLPTALWAAARSPHGSSPLAWAAIGGAAAVGFALVAAVRGVRNKALALAGTFALLITPIVLLRHGMPSPTAMTASAARTALFAAIGGGIVAAAVAVYGTSCQAGIVYAEQLRTAFDLHRRLVLRALGLKLPKDLNAERQLWKEVSLFLYRGDPPVTGTFSYDTTPPPQA